MNVIFLTIVDYTEDSKGIYGDLVSTFRSNGHHVYVVCPVQRRDSCDTAREEYDNLTILRVRTLNVKQAGLLEKGLGQLTMELLFRRAVAAHFKDIRFDLILYSTPPITFASVIGHLRKRNPQAVTYLLLKDIFPQNALDLGMMSDKGVKSVIYRYFRAKEKSLYAISDVIGCMSPANVSYLSGHNSLPERTVVEVAPNAIKLPDMPHYDDEFRRGLLAKYGIPSDRKVFIYGGNLGKPQGVPFVLECLKANASRTDCHFVIAGKGTDAGYVSKWISEASPSAVTFLGPLPSDEFDSLVSVCDAGMIFLEWRFTIPNYPSRLLPSLAFSKPVLVCTDTASDAGPIAEANGYGIWAPSNDVAAFTAAVDRLLTSDMELMGAKGRKFLEENYRVDDLYLTITSHVPSLHKADS